ncbi:MBL fold metallo-hydrolase, partial [Halobacterium salinarum]|nr:MBL fold metallo-hydrolase [Halobacterium salinarum]
MNIAYEHANPQAGNESFLIRIDEAHTERTACILVDAGDGVNLDATLNDDDYLAAILLTHAHLDHYQALDDAHRDGAPILTSPSTASILEDVF